MQKREQKKLNNKARQPLLPTHIFFFRIKYSMAYMNGCTTYIRKQKIGKRHGGMRPMGGRSEKKVSQNERRLLAKTTHRRISFPDSAASKK